MQRFFIFYALMLMITQTVVAKEPPHDRYGEPATPVLKPGPWWEGKTFSPEAIQQREGEWAQVKGRIVSTFRTREDLYLNFGEDYKTDFTVRIPKRAWKQVGTFEENSEITVRGVLREYNGPMIVVDRKEQIHYAP